MEKRKSFILYSDAAELFSMLPDASAGRVINAVFRYFSSGEVPDLKNTAEKMAFTVIRQALDRDNEKYEQISSIRSECGKKGGAKPHNTNASSKTSKTSKTSNCLDYDNVGVNETETVPVSESVNVSDAPAPDTHTPKKAYDHYGIIEMTDEEHQDLTKEFGEKAVSDCIEKMGSYCMSSGKTYLDYGAALRYWLTSDREKGTLRPPENNSSPSYDIEEWERRALENPPDLISMINRLRNE